jgi:hypothetical protein
VYLPKDALGDANATAAAAAAAAASAARRRRLDAVDARSRFECVRVSAFDEDEDEDGDDEDEDEEPPFIGVVTGVDCADFAVADVSATLIISPRVLSPPAASTAAAVAVVVAAAPMAPTVPSCRTAAQKGLEGESEKVFQGCVGTIEAEQLCINMPLRPHTPTGLRRRAASAVSRGADGDVEQSELFAAHACLCRRPR